MNKIRALVTLICFAAFGIAEPRDVVDRFVDRFLLKQTPELQAKFKEQIIEVHPKGFWHRELSWAYESHDGNFFLERGGKSFSFHKIERIESFIDPRIGEGLLIYAFKELPRFAHDWPMPPQLAEIRVQEEKLEMFGKSLRTPQHEMYTCDIGPWSERMYDKEKSLSQELRSKIRGWLATIAVSGLSEDLVQHLTVASQDEKEVAGFFINLFDR